jgi:flavin-binding protein dodecin
MDHATYSISELVGTSGDSIDDAIRNGLRTAGQSLRNLDWFEVQHIRGWLGHSSEVKQYQVTLKVGFRYETHAKKSSAGEEAG